MDRKLPSLFAGIALIVAGGLALLDSLGYVDRLPSVVWTAVFAGLSVLALIAYLISGVARWGWLFPVGVFGGLAVMLGLGTAGIRSSAVAAPLFVGLAMPFAAAYLLDIRRRWWALIPAGVMTALALLMSNADHLPGEWVGAGTLFLLAGAFLAAFLSRPARKWAALVAYSLAVIGCMPLLATADRAPVAGVAMLFAMGLPFLVIYFTSPARWWAIIPGGLLVSAGVVAAVVLLFGLKLSQELGNGLMLLGASATFATVGLRHQKRWASVAAVALALIAVGMFFFQGAALVYGPLLLVAAGAYLLYRALRPRTA